MEWIIDTGAYHHMTGSLKSMSDVMKVLLCPIGLPVGKEAIAKKERTIVLAKHLKLNNLLYVPNLKCNLILISQLIKESNCIVQFTYKFCIIQDHNSRMLIGTSEQREGLYYFWSIALVKVMKTVGNDTIDLWHQRLGHYFDKFIKLLPIVNENSNNCTDGCDICFHTKHCRGEFASSDNKASNIFAKIYGDLWVLIELQLFMVHIYFLLLLMIILDVCRVIC